MKKKSISRQMVEDLLALHYKQQNKLKKGIFFGGYHEEDVSELIKRAFWKESNESITLKINKDPDDYHITVEILELKS